MFSSIVTGVYFHIVFSWKTKQVGTSKTQILVVFLVVTDTDNVLWKYFYYCPCLDFIKGTL